MIKFADDYHLCGKRFDEWNEKKKEAHYTNKLPIYHEREIWWLMIGENIGAEINGKGDDFLRPVLVIRKYGNLFFGVPLSSQLHYGMWYDYFEYKNRTQCTLLSQSSTYSAYRLRRKIGRIPLEEFLRICNSLQLLLFKNTPNHL